MTAAEWLARPDPWHMLGLLRSPRQARLFAVALCRAYFPEHEETVLEPLEWLADGLADDDARLEAREEAAALDAGTAYTLNQRDALLAAADEPASARRVYECVERFAESQRHPPDELADLARDLARELLGNPFRPPPAARVWLSWDGGTVRRIAEGIHDEAAFGRMPILHDALLDAGCEDEAVLRHCRDGGPHARGCWVIDLLLGKG